MGRQHRRPAIANGKSAHHTSLMEFAKAFRTKERDEPGSVPMVPISEKDIALPVTEGRLPGGSRYDRPF